MIAWIVFGNGLREDASHKRTRLDPVLGEDAPRSRVRRGHASSPARRGHTSILVRRGHLDPVSGDLEDTPRSWPGEDTPRFWSGEDTSILREDAPRSCVSIGENPNSMAQVL